MRNTDFLLLFFLVIMITVSFMDYIKGGQILDYPTCYDHSKSIDQCVMEHDNK